MFPGPSWRRMTLESSIKAEIKTFIERNGWYWCAVKGGAYSKPGDPDIVACIDGRFVGIEGKTSTGTLAVQQAKRGRQIKSAGGIYLKTRSLDELRSQLRELGLLPDSPEGGSKTP